MDEARSQREAVADGVRQGYTEAKVGAGEWKSRGKPDRFWRPRQAGPTGAALESVVDRIASKHPGLVN